MKNLFAILFVMMAVIPVKAEDGGESGNTALPPAVSLSYIYLDSDSESGSDNSSDETKVRLFYAGTEGVDHIMIECLRDGFRIPTRIQIMNVEKGYYDTTIDRNTTFTAVSYNDYGYTRGIPLFVPVKITDENLPPLISMTYTYLDSDNDTDDNTSSDTKIRLSFSDTERVDRIVLERLREGFRAPSKIEITDVKKRYYDTTIDRNTTFTSVAYNDYGHTRGEPLFVPVKPTADVVEVEEPDLEVTRMLIYNLDGSIVFDGTPAAFSIDNLSSGLYIKKEILSDGGINTAKIIVR
jgi:hypothetical protein